VTLPPVVFWRSQRCPQLCQHYIWCVCIGSRSTKVIFNFQTSENWSKHSVHFCSRYLLFCKQMPLKWNLAKKPASL